MNGRNRKFVDFDIAHNKKRASEKTRQGVRAPKIYPTEYKSLPQGVTTPQPKADHTFPGKNTTTDTESDNYIIMNVNFLGCPVSKLTNHIYFSYLLQTGQR